jgi:putative ABC transport system substrate-binding protein
MRRRDFITLLGAAALAWPLAGRAQQADRTRRIGVLMPLAADDPVGQARIAALREGLEKLGWIEGRNIRIDTRWTTTGDVESMQRFAKELVALQPDLIVTQSTPITATLLQETRTIPIVFALVADPIGSGFGRSRRRLQGWSGSCWPGTKSTRSVSGWPAFRALGRSSPRRLPRR